MRTPFSQIRSVPGGMSAFPHRDIASLDAGSGSSLLALFGKERLELLLTSLADATGLAVALLDFKGDPVVDMVGISSFFQKMCENDQPAALFRSSAMYGAGQALARRNSFTYFSPWGLLEAAVPIIVANQYHGALLVGQVRCADAPEGIPRLEKLYGEELAALPRHKHAPQLFQEIPECAFTIFSRLVTLVTLLVAQLCDSVDAHADATRIDAEQVAALTSRITYLESELSRKRREISGLLARLDYHFLIGSLTAVANLAGIENAPRTTEMALLMAEHLKYGASREKSFVLLSEEITDVQRFFAMQTIRYGDMLRYEVHVPKEVAARRVPMHMVLAFAEYAVFFGLNTRDAPLTIVISGQIDGDDLILSIEDDGPGLTEEELNTRFAVFKRGYGGESVQMNLAATRRRLTDLFGADCSVTISRVPDRGTRSVVIIPAHISSGEV